MIVGVKVGSGVSVMVGSRVLVGRDVAEGCGVSVDVSVGVASEGPGEAQPDTVKRSMNNTIHCSLFNDNPPM